MKTKTENRNQKRKKPLETHRATLTLSFIDESGKRVRYAQENFMSICGAAVPFPQEQAIYMAKSAYRRIRHECEVSQ